MKEEWICQVLVDIMAAREVPAEEEVPAGPGWAVREEDREAPAWGGPAWAGPGAVFDPWSTEPHPHLPTAAPDGLPGGVVAVACFR